MLVEFAHWILDEKMLDALLCKMEQLGLKFDILTVFAKQMVIVAL